MTNGYELTIKDVLTRPGFTDAVVKAGRNGLGKSVKWTHILETNNFDSLINGGELILTTGSGLSLDTAAGLVHVQRLIDSNTAGICIEIGTNVTEVAAEIIELANKNDFPIIFFMKVVKFVDITLDLHSLLINKHHQQLNQINLLSVKFNEHSLSPNGILKILQEVHHCFGRMVFFITDGNKRYYYPPKTKQLDEAIHHYFTGSDQVDKQKFFSVNHQRFTSFPVKSLGQVYGFLCMQAEEEAFDEFFYSIIDRAASGLAQVMLRTRTIEERKQNIEDEAVRNLLQGKLDKLNEWQALFPFPEKDYQYRIFLIQSDYPVSSSDTWDWEEIKLQRSMVIRNTFKKYGFSPVVSAGKNETAVICFFSKKVWKGKDKKGLTYLIESIAAESSGFIFKGTEERFGISKKLENIRDAAKGYQEAKETVDVQNKGMNSGYFYEDLGIYRLFLLQEKENLEAYVSDCLQPILAYDQETGGQLLVTLDIYLKCGGAKKEAAEQLFIVRQTLYHRLDKIKQIIGEDFMEPGRRIALETAIKAYYFLHQQPEK